MSKKQIPQSVKTQSSDKSVKIFISVCFSLILLVVIGSLVLVTKKSKAEENPTTLNQTIDIVDGKQIIAVFAKNGFSPNVVNARADLPLVLKVKTENTFDCSATMSIPKLGIRESLPPTGSTNIQIPAQKSGTSLDATCSMGMFHMKINFIQQS
jgi:plastocyanin domain-containing protein